MPPSAKPEPTLYLSRDEALVSGRLHRDPGLIRIRRGVYAEEAGWRELAPWNRYRARVRAVSMTWKDPVFCLESAAVLLGLPIFGEPRDIHLLDVGGKSRRYGDIVVHGSTEALELTTRDGFVTTSVVDTTLELCRALPPAFALATADAAHRLHAPQSVDLSALGRERPNRRGRRQLDWVQERATPDAESPGESVSRAVIEWLGFDPPELQVSFRHEDVEDRTDFFWRSRRVIGESDGYGKYDASDAEGSKAVFLAEKVREDRLRRHVNGFARWDWSDAMRATPLGEKLSAAGVSQTRPAQKGLLATLRHNPRSIKPKAKTAGGAPPAEGSGT
ncbi:hypothetical protein [Microbacterium pumilum]|uniref:Transcriptional regulator, AbiEi antitoxin, Type IV TA system n=1 Tax=Microbacterium pumilum TaxID=344165 RepID=A0ABN2SV73_9MICO